MTAEAIGAVAPQAPAPATKIAAADTLIRLMRLISRRGEEAFAIRMSAAWQRADGLRRPRELRATTLRSTSSFEAEFLHLSVYQSENEIDPRKSRAAMRDDDRNTAALADAFDGARKRRFAFGVEIGIGFVEDDQERIFVKRTCERDALALAAGQEASGFADAGLIPRRQTQDHIVGSRDFGRGLDSGRCRIGIEP